MELLFDYSPGVPSGWRRHRSAGTDGSGYIDPKRDGVTNARATGGKISRGQSRFGCPSPLQHYAVLGLGGGASGLVWRGNRIWRASFDLRHKRLQRTKCEELPYQLWEPELPHGARVSGLV